ncbi:hypothetical protein CPB83DRAFT_839704, partial [Crepidotus variabilis]
NLSFFVQYTFTPLVDAMTSLEIIQRRLGPFLDDIALFLVENGIPFKTYLPLNRPMPANPNRSPSSSQFPRLGRRDAFLQGGLQAQVALQMGGLDLDMISGTYELESPGKVATVLGSGLMSANYGLQNCVKDIQDGAVPYSQKIWRVKLQQTRQAPKLVHHMNKAASAFIKKHL